MSEQVKWMKIVDLNEGDKFYLRGGLKLYEFIAFTGGNGGEFLNLLKGMAFMKDENGKERHQKMFPFTLVKFLLTNNTNQ